MFRKDVASLVSQTYSTDSYGDTVVTETSKVVYCTVKSISQSEFYQASAAGLKPEIKFVLSDYFDYVGEKYVVYNGIKYTVLRNFRNGNELELTCYSEVNQYTPPSP